MTPVTHPGDARSLSASSQPSRHPPVLDDRTALVLQGLQNDLLAEGGRLVDPQLSRFAEDVGMFDNVNRLASAVRDAGGTVVHALFVVDQEGRALTQNAALYRGIQEAAAVRRGTWGARIIDQCSPDDNDILIEKMRENPFLGTTLESILTGLDVRTVICAGAVTNMGVELAARHAADAGYDVIVPRDACAAPDPEWQQASLDFVMTKIAQVVQTVDLVPHATA